MADVKVVELQVKTNIEGASNNVDKLKTGLKYYLYLNQNRK